MKNYTAADSHPYATLVESNRRMVVAPAAANLAGELKDDALFDKPRCTYPRFFLLLT